MTYYQVEVWNGIKGRGSYWDVVHFYPKLDLGSLKEGITQFRAAEKAIRYAKTRVIESHAESGEFRVVVISAKGKRVIWKN